LSQNKNSIQNTRPKDRGGEEDKNYTEYRQVGMRMWLEKCSGNGDDGCRDGEGMGIKWCGWGGEGYKIFYGVIL